MKGNLFRSLHQRELGDNTKAHRPKRLYGDRKWIKDLDIVNELHAHGGCVNALSWSKSGELLASGSDDTFLNIHSFQSENSNLNLSPFQLSTSISTGHTANIFSVKFMPHSNDRILVSAAGDSDVRVFDLEYAAGSSTTQSTRAARQMHEANRYLSEADTGAKVYRSHSDRVKRIVTESSPYLFLSCSEDGEVRQWDIRQPSSAYPRPRRERHFRSQGAGDAPPPLISYKRHRLDLNTISCSPSQPHYIALGGAHLHCFLHDRRMLGRDRYEERGVRPPSAQSSHSGYSDSYDNDLLSEATQCVKRFAPQGQKRMKRNDTGHITACKISDANPNQLVASWSGDWIYSFDLVQSPDAREDQDFKQSLLPENKDSRVKNSRDRKRKRTAAGSTQSLEGAARAASKPRSTTHEEAQSLRVNYENGQSEEIPLVDQDATPASRAAWSVRTTQAERTSYQIANNSVKVRKQMFTLGDAHPIGDTDPTGYAVSFTSVLGFATSTLKDMDEVMRDWRYPVNPDELEVAFQNTLRKNRQRARRFIQASGTIARLLGANLQASTSDLVDKFAEIMPSPNEVSIDSEYEQFTYDFLKAIILWLSSGPSALIEGFSKKSGYRNKSRFPIPDGAGIDAVDEILIPYLLKSARSKPIIRVDVSRFVHDSERVIFNDDKAVRAFAQAVKIPFEDLSEGAVTVNPNQHDSDNLVAKYQAQDRKTAIRFWGLEVARGLLLNAGEGVNHALIDRAFGGVGQTSRDVKKDEIALERQLANIDPDEDDPAATSFALTSRPALDTEAPESSRPSTPPDIPTIQIDGPLPSTIETEPSEDELVSVDDVRATMSRSEDDYPDPDEESYDDHDDVDEDEDPEEFEEDAEEADSSTEETTRLLFNSAFNRSSQRSKVQMHTPCIGAQKLYRGAANTRTIKDVNFFGLNDEYVVSGSDSGHLFIWDNATGQLLNILEGDGEVVNVVQGHPYEPMIAASGIDHTVKIFSPDARARRLARLGEVTTDYKAKEVANARYQFSARQRREHLRRTMQLGDEDARETLREMEEEPSTGEESDSRFVSEPGFKYWLDDDLESEGEEKRPHYWPGGLSSKRRMHDEYRITSQNEVDRRGGNRDAFITRGMLAQLAAQIRMRRAQRAADGEGEDDDDEGPIAIEEGRIIVPDDCSVM